ncbi:30S ribosome-binding factor RbfA [Mycoplasmopsis gallinarum]|uniref:Ribosome-binding factor A n=1 Tax=Mycoplasmopsis gallinarum TaxID=29557 RepID=A0A168RFI3_9BACT|nr:30S ribosome-binding factor RbfA [Mycoplasmopsis gallinarum]OAB48930.1 Ribosome-binding factor A [Mycoplasmopsis gallinarum]
MNSNINTLRREEQIKNLIAEILAMEIHNTNVINPTVIDAKLSSDLSHVKVFVTFTEKSTKGLEALENAKGFIRTKLAKSLDWRKIPEVHFELDELTNSAMKIDKILEEIKNEK